MADDVLGGSEVRRLYEEFTTAFENEDYDALRQLLGPDAVMINPVGNVLSGRDAIVGFLQRAQRIQTVRFNPTGSSSLSETVVRQVGDLTLTMRGQGRETRDVPGKFLMVWARAENAWVIDTCVWNRRGGGQGGRQGGGPGRQGGRGFPGGGPGWQGGGGGPGRQGSGGGGPGRQGGRGRQGGGGFGGGGGGRQGGRAGMQALRPGPDDGGAFNPRNLHRDHLAPLVPVID